MKENCSVTVVMTAMVETKRGDTYGNIPAGFSNLSSFDIFKSKKHQIMPYFHQFIPWTRNDNCDML